MGIPALRDAGNTHAVTWFQQPQYHAPGEEVVRGPQGSSYTRAELAEVFRDGVADPELRALAREGGEAWGRQRFWGSASWGLGSVVVGALIDRVGLEAGLFGVSYVVSFGLLLVLLARLRPAWPRKKPVPDDAGACCGEGDAFESASDADDAPAKTKKRAPHSPPTPTSCRRATSTARTSARSRPTPPR